MTMRHKKVYFFVLKNPKLLTVNYSSTITISL